MDVITAIQAGKSLLEIGQEIAAIVRKAKDSPLVTTQVLLYLEAAQEAVNTLGLERQHILTDIRGCNIGKKEQVEALWSRLDRYLHEDNIRHHLEASINGLDACSNVIQKEATGAWWRRHNKEAAVKTFMSTLSELHSLLKRLTEDFYPGGSGMGIQTLLPIYELIDKIYKDYQHGKLRIKDSKSIEDKLGELALNALRDSSHEEWFKQTGKVEALVAELQLAFSVNITEELAKDS